MQKVDAYFLNCHTPREINKPFTAAALDFFQVRTLSKCSVLRYSFPIRTYCFKVGDFLGYNIHRM